MGLVQREIEAAGISAVSLSMIPDFTSKVGVSRLAGIAYPMSRPMGRPGDADGQRAVLAATLDVLRTATGPGTYVELPYTWPEPVGVARRCEEEPPPIAQLLKRKPWLLPRFYMGDIPVDER